MQNFKMTKIGFMNFQSFGNQMTWIDLDAAPLTSIKAINMDVGDSGESSNGGGKSTCFNAISYALYGEGVDRAKADEFINLVNGKKLLVELHFTSGDSKGVIRRGRKPNILELEMDGVSLTRDSMRNTDAAITDLVGMSYDVFMLTCYMSPNRRTFFEMDGPTQRSVMEQMLSLDVLASRADAVRKMASNAKVDLKVLNREADIKSDGLNRAEASKEKTIRLLNEFSDSKAADIDRLRRIVSEYESTDFSAIFSAFDMKRETDARIDVLLRELTDFETRYDVINKSLERHKELTDKLEAQRKLVDGFDDEINAKLVAEKAKLDYPSVPKLEESISAKITAEKADELASQARMATAAIKNFEVDLEEIQNSIKHLSDGKCPVCSGDYVDAPKIAVMREKEASLLESLTEQKELLTASTAALDAMSCESVDYYPERTVAQCEDALRKHEAIVENIDRIEASRGDNRYLPLYESTMEELSKISEEDLTGELRAMIDPIDRIETELEDLKGKTFEFGSFATERDAITAEKEYSAAVERMREVTEEPNPYTDILKQQMADIEDMEKSLKEVEVGIEELEKLEEHYGFLVKLLTDSKSFVRRRILDNYVPYINKKIVEYSTQMGLTHVCELKSDLSMEILYMNRPVSFSLMSRGEKLRLNIATTMAFRDAISLLGKGCNIALVDEFLDSALDGYGIRVGTKFITECAENVFLITHREDLSDISPRKLTVVKQNGFSSL